MLYVLNAGDWISIGCVVRLRGVLEISVELSQLVVFTYTCCSLKDPVISTAETSEKLLPSCKAT